MRYELRLMDTLSGVGCFAAHPAANLCFNEMVDHLRAHPLDSFMHEHLLAMLGGHRTRKVEKLIAQAGGEDGRARDPLLAAILLEACLGHERFANLAPRLENLDLAELSRHTPSVHIRAHRLADRALHNAWTSRMRANICDLEELPPPDEIGLAAPYAPEELAAGPAVTAAAVRTRLAPLLPPPKPRPAAAETCARANAELFAKAVFVGPEMGYRASLSPSALLRHWRLRTNVQSGGMSYSLEGVQTSYGRGPDRDAARASYLMETAERVSSYADVGPEGVLGLAAACPLLRGPQAEAEAAGGALDLSALRLEVPYEGQELWWMPAQRRTPEGLSPCRVPAQLVYLFCNLEEQSLCSGLGSTGLAAGNDMDEAKVHGLCEVLERDAEAVTPYAPGRCFRLQARDEGLKKLLAGYAECGIDVWFLDCTPEFGVPSYKALLVDKGGGVSKGTAAGLSGPRAALSALTEIPYPCPGPATRPAPDGLPERMLEDLPDLSTGSAAGDLRVLEETLLANGHPPVYADLTRRDLGIPAVRAIVPGLEFIADFDRFSRLAPRLYANYLRLFGAL